MIIYFMNLLFCTQNLHNEFTFLKHVGKLEKSCPHQKISHQNKYALPPGCTAAGLFLREHLLPCFALPPSFVIEGCATLPVEAVVLLALLVWH